MDEAAREGLAQRLTKMKLRDVLREMRSLDREANMVYWRNSMWDELKTLFLLPNVGIQITLVEKKTVSDSDREIGGGPGGSKAQNTDIEYVEARVEPLTRPAHKRGGNGPSPMKRYEDKQAEIEG